MMQYKWNLKDTIFPKDKGKVFSCFACGGGSTMGYKLAGFDVIGCNEIDPKMIEVYRENHKPKYSYLEPIQTFKLKKDLPAELYDLDILDGSPPCSSFSMSGNREKDWGKDKKFREGQSEQVLDTLFFDFIDLANELQPKVVVAENVKGLLMGSAKAYVRKIYQEFNDAGYYCQHWLLNAAEMGVPQKRERVFFICLRKDLAEKFMYQKDLFTKVPKLELEFNEKKIPFKYIDEGDVERKAIRDGLKDYYKITPMGKSVSSVHPKGMYFGTYKQDPEKVSNTVIADSGGGLMLHHNLPGYLTDNEYIKLGTFPMDYNFLKTSVKYLVGMSVPPVAMAQIAEQIHKQWLNKLPESQ